jgi:hypothetical protein
MDRDVVSGTICQKHTLVNDPGSNVEILLHTKSFLNEASEDIELLKSNVKQI